jgi:transposase
MLGADITPAALFSYRTLEERIPKEHPLRQWRVGVDAILATLDTELGARYAATGRDSIPPERLLRASLIQTLFSIRSERQWVNHLDDNRLYRWFVGLGMDEAVWNHATFSANRDRLLNETIARSFFAKVLGLAEWQGLVSDEHFSVDGTLIAAWAARKSFVKKDRTTPPPEDGGRNPMVIFTGAPRSHETQESSPDPDARLYQRSEGDKSRLCYLGHALMENRPGLAVAVETTPASGTAEREAAKTRVGRTVKKPVTLGADKGYDVAEFVKAMRGAKVTPHVAQQAKHSAIDGRTTRHAGYPQSLKIRKRIEEICGWAKTAGGLCKARLVGLARVSAQTIFTLAAYHLTRMATIFGWRLSTVGGVVRP